MLTVHANSYNFHSFFFFFNACAMSFDLVTNRVLFRGCVPGLCFVWVAYPHNVFFSVFTFADAATCRPKGSLSTCVESVAARVLSC